MWPKGYETLNQTASDADAVLVGRVGAVLGVGIIDPLRPVVYTAREFSVTTVLKGAVGRNTTIVVAQEGGLYDGRVLRTADDPLLREGNHYVLFLRSIDALPESGGGPTFAILGGPQGQFIVEGGRVSSVDTIEPEADWITVKLRGKDLADFVREARGVSN